MVMQDPYAVTKEYFARKGLLIAPLQDEDLGALIEVQYEIFKELCPRLVSWYEKHPDTFGKEFSGPKGQDTNKRVFYAIKDSEN